MNAAYKKAKRYFRVKMRSDLAAGLTVAMVVIPQAMAYAAIAGVNPIYGLFTAVIPTIIAALFGSFPFLITGPTNPTALVTASVLINQAGRTDYLEFVLGLAIIAGLFNMLFGLLKLGGIIRYISNSVLVGFLSAVGVLIISYQLGNFLGIKLDGGTGLWGVATQLINRFTNINPFTLFISLFSFGLMLLFRKINRKLPAALFTVLLASTLVYLTGWSGDQGIRLVKDFNLPDAIGLQFRIPDLTLEEFSSLIISGAAVALFSLMETLSIAKAMSQMTGDPFDPSRQIFGQGLASFVGGFFQCMPASGSPSRTVINVVNGAKTRGAAIFSGLGVWIFLLLFSGLIGYIPIATLAAVVIISASGLINIQLIKQTWQSRVQSRVVVTITFISTLVLPLEYAIYLGILSTILLYLGESSRMNLSYIVEDNQGNLLELSVDKISTQTPRIAIVNIEGDLYFAAVQDLQNQIEQILETGIKVLILRFRRTHLLASTGVMVLDNLIQSARDKHVDVIFSGINEEVLDPLESAGITEMLGESKIFLANNKLFDSTQKALAEAKSFLNNEEGSKKQGPQEVSL
jgi:SulP family sulfate permease